MDCKNKNKSEKNNEKKKQELNKHKELEKGERVRWKQIVRF